MIWLSALLVFGVVGVVLLHMTAQGAALYPGFQQMIHARIPWLLLGLLWGGAALGVAALARRRRIRDIAVLVLELPLVALVSWYFLSLSYLPEHELALGVGDPFPAWSLPDQDGVMRRADGPAPRGPALYVFYRGDW